MHNKFFLVPVRDDPNRKNFLRLCIYFIIHHISYSNDEKMVHVEDLEFKQNEKKKEKNGFVLNTYCVIAKWVVCLMGRCSRREFQFGRLKCTHNNGKIVVGFWIIITIWRYNIASRCAYLPTHPFFIGFFYSYWRVFRF